MIPCFYTFIDSGASCHITNDLKLYSEYHIFEKQSVEVANGQLVQVCGKGNVTITFQDENNITSSAILQNVLYVASIEDNLLSVKCLTRKGFNIVFKDSCCEMKRGEKQIVEDEEIKRMEEMIKRL